MSMFVCIYLSLQYVGIRDTVRRRAIETDNASQTVPITVRQVSYLTPLKSAADGPNT